MSSWTSEEVELLKQRGNDYARQSWLKHAPNAGEGGRPKEGSSLATFKQFVVNAYEYKKYYGDYEQPTAEPPQKAPPTRSKLTPAVRARVRPTPVVKKAPIVTAPTSLPAVPVLDLLSFGTETPQTSTSTSTNSIVNNEKLFDPFSLSSASTPSASISANTEKTQITPTPLTNAPAPIFDPFDLTSVQSAGSSSNIQNTNAMTTGIQKKPFMGNDRGSSVMNQFHTNGSSMPMSMPMNTQQQQQQQNIMMMQQKMMNMNMNMNGNMNGNMGMVNNMNGTMNMNNNVNINFQMNGNMGMNHMMNGNTSNPNFPSQTQPMMMNMQQQHQPHMTPMSFGGSNANNGIAISSMTGNRNSGSDTRKFDPFAGIGL